jgi:hypothetical protein
MLLCESFLVKNANYINIGPIIKHYITTGILMYTHGCNQKLCSTYVLSYGTNKKKVMGQVTPQKEDIH